MIDWKKYYSNFMKVSSINAGLFVAYRLYSHYRKNKLTYISAEDYTPYLNQNYQLLDFTHHLDRLPALAFTHQEDDLGGYVTACFQYKNIYFSLKKYDNLTKAHYNVLVDIGGCVDVDKDPEEVCAQFIEALGLKDVPVTWISDTINSHIDYVKDLNLSDVRVASEKRRETFIKEQNKHTEYLKEKLEIIKLDDYKPLDSFAILELDFSKHEDDLSVLEFEETEDDLDNISIATFKYYDVFASIQRYHNAESLRYNVYVDIDARKKYGRPEDLVRDMLRALELRNVTVSWVNPEMTDVMEAMTRWDVKKKKNNVKKANNIVVRKKND